MRLSEALGFVFEDERWVGKLLVGALISLIPIFGGIAVLGYALATLRNARVGAPTPLPTWDRWGEHFVHGLLFTVATLIYSIPLIILLCPIALVWVLPAVAGDNQGMTRVLGGIAGIFSALLGCLSFLYALVLWVLTPVLQIRCAETGELAPCLRFGEVFRFLSQHVGEVVVAQLLIWAIGFVVTSVISGAIGVLSLIPICGWVVAGLLGFVMIPLGLWLMLFSAHLYAQIGVKADTSVSLV